MNTHPFSLQHFPFLILNDGHGNPNKYGWHVINVLIFWMIKILWRFSSLCVSAWRPSLALLWWDWLLSCKCSLISFQNFSQIIFTSHSTSKLTYKSSHSSSKFSNSLWHLESSHSKLCRQLVSLVLFFHYNTLNLTKPH